LREPIEALALAREAAARMPHEAHAWGVLGTALYRNGDYTSAIDALEKTLQLRPSSETGNTATIDLFYLAMAYRQCGDRVHARQCYERAIRSLHFEPLMRHRWQFAVLLAGAPAGPLPALPALCMNQPRARVEYDNYFFRCLSEEAAALFAGSK
jgi:tetratricopeptide (TPR) repeat protein